MPEHSGQKNGVKVGVEGALWGEEGPPACEGAGAGDPRLVSEREHSFGRSTES